MYIPHWVLDGPGFEARHLAFTSDGRRLAASGSGEAVWLWDLASGPDAAVAPADPGTASSRDPTTIGPDAARTVATGWANDLLMAPDADWIVTAGSDWTVRLWDTATGRIRAELTAYRSDPTYLQHHQSRKIDVVVAPDGSWLATTGTSWVGREGGDGLVRIWDTATGALTATIDTHIGRLAHLAISPDGSFLATAASTGPVLTRTPDGAPVAALAGPVDQLVIAPNGSWLAATDDDGTVRIWDPRDGRPRHVLTGHWRAVRLAVAAPDGGWLATAGLDYSIRLWDTGTGTSLGVLKDLNEWADHIAIAPDGTWLAAAGKGVTRIWRLPTGAVLPEQPRHPQWISRLTASADSSRLISVDHDGIVRVWDPTTGEIRAERDTGSRHGLTGQPALDPHRLLLATAHFEHVELWDLSE